MSPVDVSEQKTSQSEAEECNRKKSSGVDESELMKSHTEAESKQKTPLKSEVNECDQKKCLSPVDVSEQKTSQYEADECNRKKSSGVDESELMKSHSEAESKQKTPLKSEVDKRNQKKTLSDVDVSEQKTSQAEDKNSGVDFEIDAEVVFLIFLFTSAYQYIKFLDFHVTTLHLYTYLW